MWSNSKVFFRGVDQIYGEKKKVNNFLLKFFRANLFASTSTPRDSSPEPTSKRIYWKRLASSVKPKTKGRSTSSTNCWLVATKNSRVSDDSYVLVSLFYFAHFLCIVSPDNFWPFIILTPFKKRDPNLQWLILFNLYIFKQPPVIFMATSDHWYRVFSLSNGVSLQLTLIQRTHCSGVLN